MVGRLSIGLFAGLLLIVIHFVVSLAAGLFGFAAILAVRETLRACSGRHFTRLSAIAQAVLIVLLVTSFLLVPAILGNAARAVAAPGRSVTLLPPFWFLGAQETLAGGFVDRLPRRTCHDGWSSRKNGRRRTIALRSPHFRRWRCGR